MWVLKFNCHASTWRYVVNKVPSLRKVEMYPGILKSAKHTPDAPMHIWNSFHLRTTDVIHPSAWRCYCPFNTHFQGWGSRVEQQLHSTTSSSRNGDADWSVAFSSTNWSQQLPVCVLPLPSPLLHHCNICSWCTVLIRQCTPPPSATTRTEAAEIFI